MRKIFPLITVLLLSFTHCLKAQQSEKFDPVKDQKEVNGYIIHLVPVPGNTFGFTIIKGNKAIWSQLTNPFLYGQEGFKQKADAYKLAEWIITEGHTKGVMPKYIPKELAKQLNISDALPKQ